MKLLQHYLRMHLVVESNFDFACLFHGHGTGHRMGGRRAVSEIVLRQILDMYFLELYTNNIARPCPSYNMWRRNQ